MSKVVRDFEAELAQVKQRLKDLGRDVDVSTSNVDVSGIRCDFDLPYSTLPKLHGSKWNADVKKDSNSY